jgi:hypothetical protein
MRILAVLFLLLVSAGLSYVYVHDVRMFQDNRIRENQARAIQLWPKNSSGPIQALEAQAALRSGNIPAEAEAVAMAYQQEGKPGFGCVVVSRDSYGMTDDNTTLLTVAHACRHAVGQYKDLLAVVEKLRAEPDFYKSPFRKSLHAAMSALPAGVSTGNAANVLPMLDEAKFAADQEVAIISYGPFHSDKGPPGCVLAGKMGVFKASAASETEACAKVLSMAKAARGNA